MNAPQKLPPPPAPPAAETPPRALGEPAGRSAAARAKSHSSPARPMPTVKGWPVLGVIPRIRKQGLVQVIDEEWKKQGDVFRLMIGPSPSVIVAHPDGIERVLASHKENYIKGKTYDGLRDILGQGIIAATGMQWRKQRTLMQPSFHRMGLGALVDSMVQSAQDYFEDFQSRKPGGGVIDIHREMTKVTLDVVINAMFGTGLVSAADVKYETVVATLELVGDRSNGVPVPLAIPTPGNLKFKRVLAELDAVIHTIIEKARAKKAAHPDEPDGTLLGMLLDAVDADTGRPLPDKMIRDELLTLFVAGHETTALTMTWMFTLLEGREDVWDRLRAEAAAVLGDRVPTFEDLAKLQYTRAVVDEVLRLRGPVAVVARDAVADDNILGFKINKGDRIMPYFYGVHRHPDFWERPDEFWPDRFLPENSKGRDNWAYVPFSAGQRVCIGNTFSLFESVLLLAMIAQRAEAKMVPGQSIEPAMIATVRTSAPVMVEWSWR